MDPYIPSVLFEVDISLGRTSFTEVLLCFNQLAPLQTEVEQIRLTTLFKNFGRRTALRTIQLGQNHLTEMLLYFNQLAPLQSLEVDGGVARERRPAGCSVDAVAPQEAAHGVA